MSTDRAPRAGSDRTLDHLAQALETYLNEEVDGFSGCLVDHVSPFGDGHSGCTYTAHVVGPRVLETYVLRTSVPGGPLTGPGDAGRQARIMRQLRAASLPVPRVVAAASDGALLGRSFSLVELIPGVDWRQTRSAHSDRHIAERAVDFLLRLRHVPIRDTGIGEERLSPPLAEVQRWVRVSQQIADDAWSPNAELGQALVDTAPEMSAAGLVHGDFHYGNLLFRDGLLVGVLDWEIASLGDPLFDLGGLVVASMRRQYAPEPNTAGDIEVTRDELAEMYGIDSSALDWYVSAACFKYSIILAFNLDLHRRGKKVDPIYESLQGTARGLVDDGSAILEQAQARKASRSE